ncbi:MAG: SRPBCC family protein [Solirubrobacterales bacterium]|nr:SRPBCC family protein [Solirubrobacterales bacterium]
MKLEQSFEVAAPLERVWQTLIDVEHVAPCLPGAAVTGRNDDGSYNGTFTVKIGPTTASYSGRLEMESIDEAAHSATMQAQGTDKRGQGGAKATIFSRLEPGDGAGTRVEVVTDYHITGRLARFGRGGMIEDISERLLREFAKRLQNSLTSQEDTAVAEAPAGGSSEAAAAESTPPASEEAAPAESTPLPAEPPGDGATSAPSVGEGPPPPPATPATVGAGTPPAGGAGTSPRGETVTPPGGETVTPPGAEQTPAPPPPPSPGPPPVATPPAPPTPPPGAAETRPPLQHPPEPSEPIQGLSLIGGVMWKRVKANPAPAAATVGVAVVLLMARRRRRR